MVFSTLIYAGEELSMHVGAAAGAVEVVMLVKVSVMVVDWVTILTFWGC